MKQSHSRSKQQHSGGQPAMISIAEAERLSCLRREVIIALATKAAIRSVMVPSGRVLVSRTDLERL